MTLIDLGQIRQSLTPRNQRPVVAAACLAAAAAGFVLVMPSAGLVLGLLPLVALSMALEAGILSECPEPPLAGSCRSEMDWAADLTAALREYALAAIFLCGLIYLALLPLAQLPAALQQGPIIAFLWFFGGMMALVVVLSLGLIVGPALAYSALYVIARLRGWEVLEFDARAARLSEHIYRGPLTTLFGNLEQR